MTGNILDKNVHTNCLRSPCMALAFAVPWKKCKSSENSVSDIKVRVILCGPPTKTLRYNGFANHLSFPPICIFNFWTTNKNLLFFILALWQNQHQVIPSDQESSKWWSAESQRGKGAINTEAVNHWSSCGYKSAFISVINISASSGTGNHCLLSGEHGSQGAQKDPHAASFYGMMMKHKGSTRLSFSQIFHICLQSIIHQFPATQSCLAPELSLVSLQTEEAEAVVKRGKSVRFFWVNLQQILCVKCL